MQTPIPDPPEVSTYGSVETPKRNARALTPRLWGAAWRFIPIWGCFLRVFTSSPPNPPHSLGSFWEDFRVPGSVGWGGGEEGHRAPCSCGIRVLTFPTERFAVPGAGAATQRAGGSGAAFRVGGERGRPLCPGRCAGGCAAPWPRRSPSCRAPALCSRVRRLSGVGKGPGESFWGLRESFRAPAAIPTNQSRGCRERGHRVERRMEERTGEWGGDVERQLGAPPG